MRCLNTHRWLLGGLLGLLVGCGEVSSTGTISGTVTAPAGGDVAGTRVVACYRNEPDCDTFEALISQTGASAAYRISGLPSGSYGVYALKDVDGDGSAAANGDYYGVYAPNPTQVTEVTPPAAGIDIAMRVLSGVTEPVLNAPLAVRESASNP